ncbi:MAG: cytochrome c biogenesis protein [Methanothrix sp.]|nr:cytochrome c biogenesis protein [Methanothrix sp.]
MPRRMTLSGLLILAVLLLAQPGALCQGEMAPDFSAIDLDGEEIELGSPAGEPVLLHITNIESPICRECENALSSQARELSLLHQRDPGGRIITLNIRKNPYSRDGRALAEEWWDVDVSWPWIEEYEPYQITGRYMDYTTLEGGFANPTLILIDGDRRIAGLYHVYMLGKGEVDGIQSADSLYSDLKDIKRGRFSGKAIGAGNSVTYLGMFFLGIVTSLSPCSVALLLAMFSYVMTTRRRDEYLKRTAAASKEGLMIGVAFTLGMAAVFFVVGLFLSDLGVFIRQAAYFDLAAGLLMVALGINILWPIGELLEPIRSRIPFGRASQKDPPAGSRGIMERMVHISMDLFRYSAFLGAFALGAFFALGWAPCAVSLVFPVLIWLISQDVTPLAGGMMLFVFGVGHGVPVIPIATFSRAVGGRIGERYISAGAWVTKAFGLAVIAIGLVYAARYIGFRLW